VIGQVGPTGRGECRQTVGHIDLDRHRDPGEPLHRAAYGGRYHTRQYNIEGRTDVARRSPFTFTTSTTPGW
jgi:hypothetical protein